MACLESPVRIIVGEALRLLITVEDGDTGELFDLSVFADLELEVKVADGDGDPALLAKSIGSGVTVLPQTGATLGQAEIAITTTDTSTTPWPAAPGNIGVFRYDVVGIDGAGERTILVPPSDFIVSPGVNLP